MKQITNKIDFSLVFLIVLLVPVIGCNQNKEPRIKKKHSTQFLLFGYLPALGSGSIVDMEVEPFYMDETQLEKYLIDLGVGQNEILPIDRIFWLVVQTTVKKNDMIAKRLRIIRDYTKRLHDDLYK